MDPSHIPFLDAIVADVDSDAPRLRYADFLDETGEPKHLARAEFIRVQCALEGMAREHPQYDALRSREHELLKLHWQDWFKEFRERVGWPRKFADGKGWLFRRYRHAFVLLLDSPRNGDHAVVRPTADRSVVHLDRFVFERGFVGAAILVSGKVNEEAAGLTRMLGIGTIRKITFGNRPFAFEAFLRGNVGGWLREVEFFDSDNELLNILIPSPGVEKLRRLSILNRDSGVPFRNRPDSFARLAGCISMTDLTRLSISSQDESDRVNELIGSNLLRQLYSLEINSPRVTVRFLEELIYNNVAPNLRELRVVWPHRFDSDLGAALDDRFGPDWGVEW